MMRFEEAVPREKLGDRWKVVENSYLFVWGKVKILRWRWVLGTIIYSFGVVGEG